MQASLSSTDLLRLKRWRVSTLLVTIIGYIGYYICRANLSAAFPLMSEAFDFTNSELGLIALYSEIAYATGKFINGPLGDRLGGKKIFLVGLLGAIACNFIFSLGEQLIFFILVWSVCRYFLSMGWGGLTKMIGNWYEAERNGVIMGWVSLNFQFGGVLATLFAGLIVSMGGSWRDVFIYPPLLSLVIFFYAFFASKDGPDDVIKGTSFGKSTQGKSQILEADDNSSAMDLVRGLLRLPVYRQLLAFSFLTTFLRSIFFFWTAKFLVDIGMSSSKGIFMSAIFPLLGCVGTVLLGWYTDRSSTNGNRARMMWIMLLFLVLCLLAIVFILKIAPDSQNTIVLLLGASGFFLLGPYSMSSGALTLDIAGAKTAGTCSGMIDGLGYLGGALAVWMAGRLSDSFGWPSVFALLAFMALLSMLAAFLMSREFQKVK
jgi:sugar phosphate permease